MPENTLEATSPIDIFGKRKRSRCDSTSCWSSNSPPVQRTLELDGVIEVLKEYESIEGSDINCCMCGKSYKSKVCFTKHLWEHSVYWDTFDGVKNQERVLSIQAAIILSNPLLEFLLVTSPSSQDKKREELKSGNMDNKQQSKKKRKRPYGPYHNVEED